MSLDSRPLKARLRAEIRSRLDALTPDERAAASALLVTHLATWLAARAETGRVATFAALPREPTLAGLPLRLPGWRFAYPRVARAGVMDFYEVADPALDLHPGRFGLLEPDPERCPRVDPAELDAVLCPGEAFTRRGDRLGKGGGFYDRFLPRCRPEIPRVGVAFSAQIVAEVPTDDHDHRVTWLVTEAGLLAVEP